MSDANINFNANASGLFDVLERASKGFIELAKAEQDAIKATTTLNTVTGELERTFSIALNTGLKATSVYRQNGDALELVTKRTIDNTGATAENLRQKEQQLQAEKQLASQRAQIAQSLITRIDTRQASPVNRDVLNVAQQEARLRDLVATSKVSKTEIDRIWADLANGSVRSYSGELGKLQVAIANVINSQNTLRETEAKAARDREAQLERQRLALRNFIELNRKAAEAQREAARTLQQQTQRRADAQSIGTRVQRGVDTAGARFPDILNFKQQVSRLKELVLATSSSRKQINRIWQDLTNGKVKAYTGELRRIQDALANVISAQNRLRQNAINDFGKAQDASVKAAAGVRGIGAAAQQSAKQSQNLGISLKTIVTSIALFEIRNRVFAIAGALREATATALEFSQRIAELQTISGNNQLATESWSRELRALSDSFGLDILDQTEAAYQVLSNQVAKGADTFIVLREANELALTGLSTVTESVNLLTAAINAYGLSVDDIDQLNAKFFKTVELGRLRISDLSDDFGRTAVPAKQLGVTIDELLGSVATLTIQGQKANVVNTQLRAIFLKMIKPTTELQKLFEELGVGSGEALIKTFGFAGSLDILEQRTRGATNELGALFSRLRAVQGGLGLTSNLELLRKNIDAIADSGESFETALEIIFGSAGRQIEIQLNKIKNILINDFGKGIVDILAKINKNFIELSVAIKVAFSAAKGLAALVATLLIPVISKLGGVIATAFKANPVLAIAAAISTLITVIAEFELARLDAELNFTSVLDQENKKRTKLTEQELKKTLAFYDRSFKDQLATVVGFISTANKDLSDLFNETSEDAQELDSVIEETAKSIEKNLGEAVKASEKNLQNLTKEADSVFKEIGSLARKLDIELFKIDLGEADVTRQLTLIQSRINKLNEDARRAGEAGFGGKAITLQREAFNLVKQQGKLQSQIRDANAKATEKQAKLQAKLVEAQSEGATEEFNLAQKINRERDRDKRIKLEEKLIKERQKNNKEVAKITTELSKINIISIKEIDIREALTKQSNANRKILVDTAKVIQTSQTKQLTFLNEQRAKLESIRSIRDDLKKQDDDAIRGAKTQEDLNKILNARVEILNKLLGLAREQNADTSSVEAIQKRLASIPTLAGIQTTILDNTGQINTLSEATKAASDEAKKLSTEFLGLKGRVDSSLPAFKLLSELDLTLFGEDTQKQIGFTEAIQANLKGIIKDGKISAEEVGKLQKILNNFDAKKLDQLFKGIDVSNAVGVFGTSQVIGKEEKDSLELALRALLKARIALRDFDSTKFLDLEKRKEELDEIVKINNINLKLLRDQQRAERDKGNEAARTNEVYRKQAAELRRISQLQFQRLQPLVIPFNPLAPPGFASGGPIGTDSIRANLSPGEFVVNAASARLFSNELRAINSSTQPQGFESGGDVTNVGDINVTVQSTGNESIDARQLGLEIKREIRRGTLKWD